MSEERAEYTVIPAAKVEAEIAGQQARLPLFNTVPSVCIAFLSGTFKQIEGTIRNPAGARITRATIFVGRPLKSSDVAQPLVPAELVCYGVGLAAVVFRYSRASDQIVIPQARYVWFPVANGSHVVGWACQNAVNVTALSTKRWASKTATQRQFSKDVMEEHRRTLEDAEAPEDCLW